MGSTDRQQALSKVYDLAFQYERINGSCPQCVLAAVQALCAEVQTNVMGRSYNFWDRKDHQALLADGGHEDKCAHVAGTAAKIHFRGINHLEVQDWQ
jgi:hypothetical protein